MAEIELLETVTKVSMDELDSANKIIDALSKLSSFAEANWGYLVSAALIIVGVTSWLHQVYQIKKLRLEIKNLSQKAADEDAPSIIIATLDDIEKYSRTTRDPKKIRRLMRERASELLKKPDSSEDAELAEAKFQVAQTLLLRSDSLVLFDRLALVLVVVFSTTSLTPLIEWLVTSSHPVVESLRLLLSLAAFAGISVAAVVWICQGLAWLLEKIFPEK